MKQADEGQRSHWQLLQPTKGWFSSKNTINSGKAWTVNLTFQKITKKKMKSCQIKFGQEENYIMIEII